MKKIIAVMVAALTMLFTFAGCFEPEDDGPQIIPDETAGTYALLQKNNPDVNLEEFFGSTYQKKGAYLVITKSGKFTFKIGASGGSGTVEPDGENYKATYTDDMEKQAVTTTLTRNNDYLVMNMNDTYLVWSKSK